MARIAWPNWTLVNQQPSYNDVLWEMMANGLANNKQKCAWNSIFECAIRALWITRCANKMGETPHTFTRTLGVFLALYGCTLEVIYLDYSRSNRDTQDFLRDWCGEGRIAYINPGNRKLRIGWWRREQ